MERCTFRCSNIGLSSFFISIMIIIRSFLFWIFDVNSTKNNNRRPKEGEGIPKERPSQSKVRRGSNNEAHRPTKAPQRSPTGTKEAKRHQRGTKGRPGGAQRVPKEGHFESCPKRHARRPERKPKRNKNERSQKISKMVQREPKGIQNGTFLRGRTQIFACFIFRGRILFEGC